jgi:hypothetical protein
MNQTRRFARALPAFLLLASVGVSAQTATPTAPVSAASPANSQSKPQGPTARPVAPPSANAAPDPEALFASWDRNKDRSLSLQEFKDGWQRAREAQVINRLVGLFRVTDANHNGMLEPAEYSSLPIFKHAGDAAPPMSTFDTNKNNSLDEKEYFRMVETLVRAAATQGAD